MLAVRCPRCGQPAPAALSDLTSLSCTACGQRSAMPPEAAQRLGAALHVVRQQTARERQFSGLKGRVVLDSRIQLVLFALVASVLTCPFLCLVGYVPFSGNEYTATPSNFAIFFAAAALVVATSSLGFALMRRRLRALRGAIAAVPPQRPGEPSGCHVCGAPLHPSPDTPFTRCGFCATDNLTDPEALASLDRRRALVLEDQAATLKQQLVGVKRAFRRSLFALVFGSLAAIPLSCTCLCLPLFALDELIVLDPYEDRRYALVDAPEGRCIAWVVPAGRDSTVVQLIANGTSASIDDRPADAVPTTDYSAFVGQPVQTRREPQIIERVVGSFVTGGNAAIPAEGRRRSLHAFCLAPGATTPVAPVPARAE